MYEVDDETMCCFYASMFIHGFCLPCCPIVEKLLKFFDVAPSQIAVGGWIYIIAFVVRCLEDDEVRALVAWVGWVDGCLIPSAQDYLVSRRNAFFFCVEYQLFLPFIFPAPFTIIETAPAITATKSDHDQEGITIFFSSCIIVFHKLLVSYDACFV
ncbi:hypothetical protein ACFE04_021160 [Oxalis oulophora]